MARAKPTSPAAGMVAVAALATPTSPAEGIDAVAAPAKPASAVAGIVVAAEAQEEQAALALAGPSAAVAEWPVGVRLTAYCHRVSYSQYRPTMCPSLTT